MSVGEFIKRLFRGLRGTAPAGVSDSLSLSEDEDDLDPFNPFTEPVRIEIRDVFDLHSIPPRDLRAVVEEYLLEARRAGFRQVRIIHGKGVGVQRETVRSVLARMPFVEHYADAPPEAGGWGATVVRMMEARRGMSDEG
ncbi:MAG: Smr/MutS family protein [Acidobacteria bacterium]|nr:Smr/MutS family protein [Acidobacteriota bacterium]